MIVIPMAGLSKRFLDAGYDKPKYMLPLGEQTVFDHAVGSFQAYFQTLPFLFIVRDVEHTPDFVTQSCSRLGIGSARVVALDAPTAGQAETVELGLHQAGVAANVPITIFNIDTFRPGFRFPEAPWRRDSAGYLEVFVGEGANWSYVRPNNDGSQRVLETAEKRPISNLCCTGLYHFERLGDFLFALEKEKNQPTSLELYVAPLFNHLIVQTRNINYFVVERDQVIFCGVPTEYRALLRAYDGHFGTEVYDGGE